MIPLYNEIGIIRNKMVPDRLTDEDLPIRAAIPDRCAKQWYNTFCKCPGGSIGQSKALLTLRLWVRVPPGVQGDQIHEFVKKITLLVIMRSVSF